MSQSDLPELTPVREAHRIDEESLKAYLGQYIDDDFTSITLQQFEGGQSNPTYLLTTAARQYVVRKKPPGQLLKSAHQVDREYRVMHALQGSKVPVPKTYLLCEDESIVGQTFYVMGHAEGRVITDPALPNVARDDCSKLYDDFMRVLAELHKVDLDAVGLSDFGRPGNYYERQISRWTKQYRASETETIPEMDALIEWFPANIPDSDETTLVHGDYRIGNTITHLTEPRIEAVLDWELCTTGHPLGDLGYNCMIFYTADRQELLDAGIPSEEDLLNTYCTHVGRDPIDNWPFFIIYNLFRIGAIVQGVYKRGLDGNASSDTWAERKDQCRQNAEAAWALVEKQ